MRVFRDVFPTAWGWAGAVWSDRGLQGIVLPRPSRRQALRLVERKHGARARDGVWEDLRRQVTGYFETGSATLEIPLDLEKGTPFVERVRLAVREVPHGGTATYGEIALRAGSPGGARAVGQVMGANPVPLYIPCHRIVAACGPGGFSAGGERYKIRLLQLEAGGAG